MEKLSVIIITKNEEFDLGECLESVGDLAAQVILIDDHSTDRTVEIAKHHGAETFLKKWEGFGPQKQFALDKARHEWVLNVDADERLSPALREEIRHALDLSSSVNGYRLPFQHVFMGRTLRFGAGRGESHVRLFRRTKARYTQKIVHEGIQVEPPLGSLKNPVRHLSYRSLSDYLGKCDRYTTLLAREKWEQGRRFSSWDHLKLPLGFAQHYLLGLGFLDGQAGFTYAALSAYYSWMKSLKLADLERGGRPHGF
jgi:glycosyltransferase involved in cell wall biosynthesis